MTSVLGRKSGTDGTVKFTIQVDDTSVSQKLNNFKSSLERINFATQPTTKSIGTFSNNLKGLENPLNG
jgi:hypothetical protein